MTKVPIFSVAPLRPGNGRTEGCLRTRLPLTSISLDILFELVIINVNPLINIFNIALDNINFPSKHLSNATDAP